VFGPSTRSQRLICPRTPELSPDDAVSLELVAVSHGDDDNIRGILDLLSDMRTAQEDRVSRLIRDATRALSEARQAIHFEEGGRNGGAVHTDERAIAARARLVDQARRQLLAGAGLAGQEHVISVTPDPVEIRPESIHRDAVADQQGPGPQARAATSSESSGSAK
jgi:hypothetical protein